MTKSSIFEKIFSLFNKSKYQKVNLIAATEAIQTLISRMQTLDQKSLNIKEQYPDFANRIHDCLATLQSIEPSGSVRAGKFEQQISVAITQVSTSCDQIFTSLDSDKLDQQISLLERNIRERLNADVPLEE